MKKSKTAAALLSFFLGRWGAHRYYLGYKIEGFVQALGGIMLFRGIFEEFGPYYIAYSYYRPNGLLDFFRILFIAATGIWALVDFIRILTGSLPPADGSEYVGNASSHNVEKLLSAEDSLDVLEQIAILHEQGILSDEEFEAKKRELLKRM